MYFTAKDSIVRQIWGKADTILFIFAGASAEFTLNRAVDWLYFTGRLPADPLGRLFSTVGYSRKIIFSEYDTALHYIDQITSIHNAVETTRGTKIPDDAYLEVLYMLIDYSIRAFELLERKLTLAENEEVFHVFSRVGKRMQLKGLASSHEQYLADRNKQLRFDLCYSRFTPDLFKRYKQHLGSIRYAVLRQAQLLMAPREISQKLKFGSVRWLRPVLWLYKFFRLIRLENVLKLAILPPAYISQIRELDIAE
jgi:hypothetical protein